MMTIMKDSLKLETQVPGALSLMAWSQKRLVAGPKHENSLTETTVIVSIEDFLVLSFPSTIN